MSKYNATVYKTGPLSSTFVAQVEIINGRPQMLRSNSVSCTGYEGHTFTVNNLDNGWNAGDAVYDWYIREMHKDYIFEIAMDNCEGYRNQIRGMATPPAYRS